MGFEGAYNMAEVLRGNGSIQDFNLEGNTLGDWGVVLLAEALEVNTTMKILCLQANRIGDYSAWALANTLRYNKHINEINVFNNLLTPNAKLKIRGIDEAGVLRM